MRKCNLKWIVLLSFMLMFSFSFPNMIFAKSKGSHGQRFFRRIATFPVFFNTDVDLETVAEIVAATKDGKLLVYTDSETENIGFVNIRNPYKPMPDGVVKVDGEPTSVAVLDRHRRKFALAAVDTSVDFVNTSGLLQVLPAGVGPEGLLAIPQRNLFVVASEVDNRGDKIRSSIFLPDSVNALQRRFGFEGVAECVSKDDKGFENEDEKEDDHCDFVYVAFQREWVGDPDDHVRIGRYDTKNEKWAFYYYPIDTPTSPNDGWVGLSEIVAIGDDNFAVIERDNQAGTDARIKKIYEFSVAGLTPQPQDSETPFPVLEKELVRDLIPDLTADNGFVLEKVEGLMVTAKGDALIVTDNDGVDDSSGETQLIDLGYIF